MLRFNDIRLALMLSGLGLLVTGCTSSLLNTEMLKPSNFTPSLMDGHGTEQRVITQFTDSLAEDKESAFRRIVSTRFEQKALRSPESYKDLEILNLPKVPLEVVESKEIENGAREVVAKEEKEGTKYQFIILRDPVKKHWVVDDVMLRQQKKGTRASKSSVEVMDLLLTTREFLDIWKAADREVVLNALAPELRSPMSDLPEPWLQRLIERVSAEYETGMARRPVAQMNESDAVVKLPSKNGFLLLKVVRGDDQWLVSDIEVRNRKSDDHPGSILRQARALMAVTRFLEAYNANDPSKLKELTESKFFESSLKVGDLTMIPMPSPDYAPDDFEIQSFAGQLTIMIPQESNVARLDLTTPEAANAKVDRKRVISTGVEAKFIIANVTVYDRHTEQQRNLKSAFTAPARAMLFLSALWTHDLPMLKQTSTKSLAEGSWDRVDKSLVSYLPLTGVPAGEMTLQASHVRGEVTELEFISSSGQVCSVIMRDENGELKVDDVEYPDTFAKVASLKTQLILTVPVIELSQAWKSGDLNQVRRTSSMDFNRLVWSNLTDLPDQFEQLPDLLLMPVQKSEAGEQRAMVALTEKGKPYVTVTLLKENSSWVVDEVAMKHVDGTSFELRKSLRHEIAKQFLIDPSGGIQQASFDSVRDEPGSAIVQAGGMNPQKPRGNLTLQSYGKPAGKVSPPMGGIDMTLDVSDDLADPTAQPVEESGTLHFGPVDRKTAGLIKNQMPSSSPQVRTRTAQAEEHDGVVYFKGEDSKSPTAKSTDDSVNADRKPITDPSQNPIEIPLE
jgi:hypothetical protein